MSALDKAARVVEASFMLWDQEVTPQQATAIARAVLMAVRDSVEDERRSPVGNAIWRARINTILSES